MRLVFLKEDSHPVSFPSAEKWKSQDMSLTQPTESSQERFCQPTWEPGPRASWQELGASQEQAGQRPEPAQEGSSWLLALPQKQLPQFLLSARLSVELRCQALKGSQWCQVPAVMAGKGITHLDEGLPPLPMNPVSP